MAGDRMMACLLILMEYQRKYLNKNMHLIRAPYRYVSEQDRMDKY